MIQIPVARTGAIEVPLPVRQTSLSAGMDLHAALAEEIVIAPGARVLVSSGLTIAIPPGFEGQVRPRSGLAYKHGITVLNSPGTIDADYRGEVKVLLINLGADPFVLRPLERMAQLVIASVVSTEWHLVTQLDETVRGTGGYGSTGHS